jgi:hypothetical protein
MFATDKKVRDQALDSLKTYLGAQSEIAELDLLKLWKGLFYCMHSSCLDVKEHHKALRDTSRTG